MQNIEIVRSLRELKIPQLERTRKVLWCTTQFFFKGYMDRESFGCFAIEHDVCHSLCFVLRRDKCRLVRGTNCCVFSAV